MRVNLTVNAGPEAGRVFEFDGHAVFLVGRSRDAHFPLADEGKSISRLHFMVEVNPPRCRLTDLGSTNGTTVNGRRVATAELVDGDVIRIGRTRLGVSVFADPSPAAPVGPVGPRLHPPRARAASPVKAPGLCPSCSAETARAGRRGEPARGVESLVCVECLGRIKALPQTAPGYTLVRELGRGGMGVVYLGLRNADAFRVAVKTVRPEASLNETDVQRFLREARILGELDHPYIVSFREMGESGGVFNFAMDYVDGVDAARLRKSQGGALPVGRAVGLVCQLLQALEYAHAKGFVHRDVKPANLLVSVVDGRDALKLSDFGLARAYQASAFSGLTLQGDCAGTFAYMAPEQVTNFREAGPPVDQYGAAATLYNMITGRYVHDMPPDLPGQVRAVLHGDPVPIRARRPGLPEGLASVIHRSLARDPAGRFENVRLMRRALAPFAT